MDRIRDFCFYPFAVLNWAVTAWWRIFRRHYGWAALFTVASFLVGALLHHDIVNWWPALAEFLGQPMNRVWIFLVYSILSMFVLHIWAFCVLLIASPSQIWHENKQKIKSLVPPPLNLYFKSLLGAATESEIQLIDITLTNRSQTTMNLIFIMAIKYTKDDGSEGGTRIQGGWYSSIAQSIGDKSVEVNAYATRNGSLMFILPKTLESFGISKWAIPFPDKRCILEIKDTVSDTRIACEPMPGFPDGAILT
jgi:hypothetical protein